jgi:hypothetical protein
VAQVSQFVREEMDHIREGEHAPAARIRLGISEELENQPGEQRVERLAVELELTRSG